MDLNFSGRACRNLWHLALARFMAYALARFMANALDEFQKRFQTRTLQLLFMEMAIFGVCAFSAFVLFDLGTEWDRVLIRVCLC